MSTPISRYFLDHSKAPTLRQMGTITPGRHATPFVKNNTTGNLVPAGRLNTTGSSITSNKEARVELHIVSETKDGERIPAEIGGTAGLPKYISDETINPEIMKQKREQVIRALSSFPVIDGPRTLATLPDEAYQYFILSKQRSSQPNKVFFGVGLCTRKELSQGLPFEVIGQICAAEWVRRALGLEKILIIVADSHAKTNMNVSQAYGDAEIDKLASDTKDLLIKITHALKLEKNTINIQLASEFIGDSGQSLERNADYKTIEDLVRQRFFPSKIAQALPEESLLYTAGQVATIEYMRRVGLIRAKISWHVPEKRRTSKTFDETFFDDLHRELFKVRGTENTRLVDSSLFSSIATAHGHTFDPTRPLIPPYIVLAKDAQLALEPFRNCQETIHRFFKPGHHSSHVMALHIRNVIDAIELVLGHPVPGIKYATKADNFLDRIFGHENRIKGRKMKQRSPILAEFEKLLRYGKER